MDSISGYAWCYKIDKGVLYLYSHDVATDTWAAPLVSITDGLKFEYLTGKKVFLKSDGTSDDTVPSEASIVNVPDAMIPAVIAFLRSRLTTDKKSSNLFYTEYLFHFHRAKEKYGNQFPASIPKGPYKF
jgi:hypothetical protein